jgi:Protein tyrosine and serine/threonine kinase
MSVLCAPAVMQEDRQEAWVKELEAPPQLSVEPDEYPSDDDLSELAFLGRRNSSRHTHHHSSEPVLDVDWHELTELTHLNSGSMCTIFSCIWRGSSDVVAKLVRTDCADPEVAASDLELELQVLRKLRHPNVVRLLGAGMHPRRGRFLLLEKLHGGTLSDRLELHRK